MLEYGKIFEGLDQVVGSAKAQGLDCIAHHARAGNDDDRRLRSDGGDLTDQLKPAHLWHA